MSSSDLSLIYQFVLTCDDVEDFARNVSFDAADRFEFGVALGYSSRHVFLGLWVKPQPSDCDDVKGAVGCAVAAPIQSVPCRFP